MYWVIVCSIIKTLFVMPFGRFGPIIGGSKPAVFFPGSFGCDHYYGSRPLTIALLFQTSTSVTRTRGFASTADAGIRPARICASVSRDTRSHRTGLSARTWTNANGNRAFAGTASAPTPTDRSSVCATRVTGCHLTGKIVSVRCIRFQTDTLVI